ncbi:MAG TPA: molybdopterin cofactor-binding domain-containing protein [Bryobacteraceae bacterium]|nr:molybdopterin cofactor-binding domain-containing protein [Bryobacteraceae bacterium]
MNGTRRAFIAQGAGLVLAFRLPVSMKAAEDAVFEPNAYIRIASDNTITLTITRSEMGQGVRTLLATVLAEELEVDPARVHLEQAVPGPRFKGIRLRTSGSGSSSGTFRALRTAGASARQMLIAAAAAQWKVEPSACRAEQGTVVDPASGRRLAYGELAAAASHLPVPANPRLKPLAEFRLIGKRQNRIDAEAIVRGAAPYGIDTRIDGMVFAAVARCPFPGGGSLRSFDSKAALAVPGVSAAIPVRSGFFGGGVAVIATNTWAAFRGRDALRVEWNPGPAEHFDSARFIETLAGAASQEGYPIRREGAWEAGIASGAPSLEATYEYPFQAHAPLEVMNCTAHVQPGSCDVWAPTQAPETAQQHVSDALGLAPDAVRIHTTLLGGGFGRRLGVDYVDEAVEISKAIGKPVHLVWSRGDDMRHGFFHPASVEKMSAWLGGNTVRVWSHRSMGSDLSALGQLTPEQKADRRHYADEEEPWGAFDTFYNFAALKVDYVPVDSPVPTGPWRAVMYPARVFARESFLDEVAHALNRDPIDLRLELLRPGGIAKIGSQEISRDRMARVLEEVRDRSGWKRPLTIAGAGRRLTGRGIAVNIYAGDSCIAQVAEVSVSPDHSDFRVHRIVCVVDCGLPLNPAGLEGQVESGIAWGLSAALGGKINFREGRVAESGYHDFRVIRMNEMPQIETHILPGTAALGGFGEHPVPPVAPAVANALFQAAGKRVRRLPLSLA